MEPTRVSRIASTLLALLVLSTSLGVANSAGAEEQTSCVATPEEPSCAFTCPAYGVVKVVVEGPGDEGWIQGSIACGTPPGTSGYIQGMTVVCQEDEGSGDPVRQVWDAVFDDGECSAEMFNSGDGTLGRCWLNAGTRAVCSIERESILPEV